MRFHKFAAVAIALTCAEVAHAQVGGAPPPASPMPTAPPSIEFHGPDERLSDFNRLRDDVARPGRTRSTRPVPVSPEDVTTGSEVRDSKGVVIGSIASVGMDFAVIASPGGRIEIEFKSLAKNNKGLLINMPKAKFDAILAGGKPKN